jgi:hypothetical protein
LPLQPRDIGAKDNHDNVQTLKEIIKNIFGMQRNLTSNKSLRKKLAILAKLQGSP